MNSSNTIKLLKSKLTGIIIIEESTYRSKRAMVFETGK